MVNAIHNSGVYESHKNPDGHLYTNVAPATQLNVSSAAAGVHTPGHASACGMRCFTAGDACGGYAFSQSQHLCQLYSQAQMAVEALRDAAADFDLYE